MENSISTSGNRTYVGYLYTEVTYNNSVVRVFVQLLQDSVVKRGRLSGGARGRMMINRSTDIVSSPTLTTGRTKNTVILFSSTLTTEN